MTRHTTLIILAYLAILAVMAANNYALRLELSQVATRYQEQTLGYPNTSNPRVPL